jgi:hypothetical protein
MTKPAWAENTNAEQILQKMGGREGHLLWQLEWYAEHPHTMFDATFYDREPILEVTLAKNFARALCAAFMYDKSVECIKQLLQHVAFSNGTMVDWTRIWTLNYMPSNLDIANVDLSEAEQIIGLGGETLREIIRTTYRCKSRAEEDWFVRRWIAS